MQRQVSGVAIGLVLSVSLGTAASFAAEQFDDDVCEIQVRGTAASDGGALKYYRPIYVTLKCTNPSAGSETLRNVSATLEVYKVSFPSLPGLTLRVSKSMLFYEPYIPYAGVFDTGPGIYLHRNSVDTIAQGDIPANTLSAGTYVIQVRLRGDSGPLLDTVIEMRPSAVIEVR